MGIRAAIWVIGAVLLLPGCATRPPTPPAPVVQPPLAWTASAGAATAYADGWLNDFDAPGLDALVAEALAANPDLSAVAARVAAARARARSSGAARLPEADLSFSAQRTKRAPSGLSASSATPVSTFGLDATVAWEADLWGRLGDDARAAAVDARAADADYAAARLTLAAEVARAWFASTEAAAQLHLSERTVASFRQARDVIEERYRQGLGTALDVHLARENAATAESALAQRRREHDGAVRVLEALLGRYPAAALAADRPLPTVRGAVPAGLPADLLARRPDLRAAEMRLESAGHRLSAAKKNRLPGIRLTTSAGTASSDLGNLLDWDRLVWNLLAGVTQPLFSGGRLAAEQALAQADHGEAWAAYAQAVLTAFREVETALSAEAFYIDQGAALEVASVEAQAAAELAFERYGQGLTDMVTLLDAQRRAFTAESNRLSTIRQRLDNRVDLYLALGGDFAPPQDNQQVTP